MITTKTTFVVGAGASEPYGLPLAAELADRARGLSPKSPLVQLLYQKFQIQPVNDWLEDFKKQHISLDKFLQERHGYPGYTEIGKHVIAGLMGVAIQPGAHVDDDSYSSSVVIFRTQHAADDARDWIECLVDVMALGTNSLADFGARNTGVQFVTFNFDTLIEDRIRGLLERRWPAEAGLAADVRARCCPVHHVHGAITAPPSGPPWRELYGVTPGWNEWIAKAAAAIRIVHDTDVDQETILRATAALAGARVQVWLGLHYHQENLNRLGLAGGAANAGKSVFGTAFGVPPGRRGWVSRHITGIELGGPERTCMQFLDDVDWQL